MKFSSLLSLVFLALLSFSKGQTVTLPTISDVTPAAGVEVNSDIVVVAGNADGSSTSTTGTGTTATTTSSGVAKVEYRLSGSKKWKSATLTQGGASTTGFVITFKLGKGKSTIILIRAVDFNGNESDILGREIQRSHLRSKHQNIPTE